MPIEIERKFLLRNNTWRTLIVRSEHLRQAYLLVDEVSTVRLRTVNGTTILTIKGRRVGNERPEYECEFPTELADDLLSRVAWSGVDKIRHYVHLNELTFTIDEFSGENKGLILAEIESDDGTWPQVWPSWIGEEVTDEERYYSSRLSKHGYFAWGIDELKGT